MPRGVKTCKLCLAERTEDREELARRLDDPAQRPLVAAEFGISLHALAIHRAHAAMRGRKRSPVATAPPVAESDRPPPRLTNEPEPRERSSPRTLEHDLDWVLGGLKQQLRSFDRSQPSEGQLKLMREMRGTIAALAKLKAGSQDKDASLKRFLDEAGQVSREAALALIRTGLEIESLDEERKSELCLRYLHELWVRRPDLKPQALWS